MTKAEQQDKHLRSYDFNSVGDFKESEIEGITADIQMEEGGDFETGASYEKDGETERREYLRLYHRQKYSRHSGRPY